MAKAAEMACGIAATGQNAEADAKMYSIPGNADPLAINLLPETMLVTCQSSGASRSIPFVESIPVGWIGPAGNRCRLRLVKPEEDISLPLNEAGRNLGPPA